MTHQFHPDGEGGRSGRPESNFSSGFLSIIIFSFLKMPTGKTKRADDLERRSRTRLRTSNYVTGTIPEEKT